MSVAFIRGKLGNASELTRFLTPQGLASGKAVAQMFGAVHAMQLIAGQDLNLDDVKITYEMGEGVIIFSHAFKEGSCFQTKLKAQLEPHSNKFHDFSEISVTTFKL